MSTRNLWMPRVDTDAVEVLGKKWPPVVIVTMWEENDIGERRYVGTRSYAPHPEADSDPCFGERDGHPCGLPAEDAVHQMVPRYDRHPFLDEDRA